DVITCLIIIIIFLILAKIIEFFVMRLIKISKTTKTNLDDKILQTVRIPILILVIFAGIYFGLIQLNILSKYHQEIDKFFAAFYILVIALLITRIINSIFKWYAEEFALKAGTKIDKEFLPILKKIVNGFVYAIATIILLKEIFNIEIGPLLAGLGIAGLAVALALQDTLKNLFAGMHIIADGSIKFGNYIELENGMKGYVEDIGWRTTKIRSIDNNLIVIPNSKLAQSIVVNYYATQEEVSVVVPCGVSYNSDLDKVEKVTIEVAKEIQNIVPGAVKNFEPFVRYNKFGDSNIEFNVVLKVNNYRDKSIIMHEFIKKLKKRYDEEGIEISPPIRNVKII
ncbi:MAG: mechanosensitive ion channel family protein, partial [Candidatus Altarchaeaceae archaeon]